MIPDELRQQVIEKIVESKSLAKQKLGLELPPITLLFDLKGNRAGEAWSYYNKIRLNEDYLRRFPDTMVSQTIPHEVAHLVADKYYKKNCHHTKLWCNIMVSVYDLPPRRTHLYGKSLDGRTRKASKYYTLICKRCLHIHKFGHIWKNRIALTGIIHFRCRNCQNYFCGLEQITLDIE